MFIYIFISIFAAKLQKMDTERSLYEIEIALAKSDKFNYIKNIVAFNVNGFGETLPIHHECDMLVLSNSGYLTEIEIKRSWQDFLADFKKRHHHESEKRIIKYFYYCVPKKLLDKVWDKLTELNISYSGVITYDENLYIEVWGNKYIIDKNKEYKERGWGTMMKSPILAYQARKLYVEERLQVARFGAMRAIMLREKVLKLQKENI